jgi:glycosyltransferase involved in cell wall biosynthesis
MSSHIAREPSFLHVAGRSGNKGTDAVIEAWLRRPDWPSLTVVQRGKPTRAVSAANLRVLTHYLRDEELRTLQNRSLFHLCPSETEGFGHHLVEAMSVGAVVLTTDAEPMNELVEADRGILVPYARTGTQHLASTYFVGADAVGAGVDRMLALGPGERRLLGERARAWYETNDRAFRQRFPAVVGELAG